MADMQMLLIVNPGATSTKVAVFDDSAVVLEKSVKHPLGEMEQYPHIVDQLGYRQERVVAVLHEGKIELKSLSAVVGRGGLLKPCKGGTYRVNEAVLRDLRAGVSGEHASNLGGLLAHAIAAPLGIPAFIADPVVVDEIAEVARVSGMPEIERKSIFHALNQKAMARRAAREMGKDYADANFIVAHIGAGASVGAHRRGRVVDVNNTLNGEGPFSPERSGGVPVGDLVALCFSGRHTREEIDKKIVGKGGLMAYLGTNDNAEIVRRIEAGDKRARLIYEAMAYQAAKEIGACAAVLKGEIDAIVLTGGFAHDAAFVELIKERVSFIAPVKVYPGEHEMIALAEAGLRVLRGEEEALEYE